MIAPTTAEDLRRIWDACDRLEHQLVQELADVRAEKAACELLLTRHVTVKNTAPSGTAAHAHIRPSSLAQCATQMDAFKEIARRSGGIVRLTEACKLVHAAGLSNGKVSSIVSSMPRKFLEKGEWEWADSGVYRLLKHGGNVRIEDFGPGDAEEVKEDPTAVSMIMPSSDDAADAA